MTSGEQRENVATAVLFISGEDERINRATLVKQALRTLRTYIVELLSFSLHHKCFFSLMPHAQIETLVVEREKIITPLYMDTGA